MRQRCAQCFCIVGLDEGTADYPVIMSILVAMSSAKLIKSGFDGASTEVASIMVSICSNNSNPLCKL